MMSRSITGVVLGALAVALILVATLAAQNRELKERVRILAERSRVPYRGYAVPAFDGTTLAGDSVRIGETVEQAGQVLFFLTTTCPYCRSSIPAWKEIAQGPGRERGVAVYGIPLDSARLAKAYAKAHDLTFPLVPLPDQRLRQWYRVRAVPTTIVLDASGVVRYARSGELIGREVIDSVLTAVAELFDPEPADALATARQ